MDENLTTNQGTPDAFLTQLQGRLLNQADMISSSSTGLESKIQSAITSTQRAGESSAQATTSAFDREIGFQREQASQVREGARETQRGFAVNTAALKDLDARTEKSLRDLEQRKQELILQGDAATASKIADLQLQSIQFQQQAQQQAFSNLLSLGTLELQRSAQEQAAREFKTNIDIQRQQLAFNQKSTMASLATEFGATIREGDTLESVVARIAPQAKAESQARLQRLLEDTRKETMRINADSELTKFVTEEGMTPFQAASATIATIQAVGGDVDNELFEEYVSRATQMQSDFEASRQLEEAKNERRQQRFVGGVIADLTKRAATAQPGSPARGDADIFGANVDDVKSFFGSIFGGE